jgi:hypothetical protein
MYLSPTVAVFAWVGLSLWRDRGRGRGRLGPTGSAHLFGEGGSEEPASGDGRDHREGGAAAYRDGCREE